MLAIYLSMIDNEENKDKFEEVYLQYSDIMLNRAYKILGDFELAEDAVHNAFLRILKNLYKIDEVDDVKTRSFVFIVVDNVAKSMYNKEHKKVIIEYRELESKINVQNIIEDRDAVRHILDKINSLPDIYRYVFFLKYFNNFSDKEIANALDTPVPTVRKRLVRGKKLLTKLLERGEYNE